MQDFTQKAKIGRLYPEVGGVRAVNFCAATVADIEVVVYGDSSVEGTLTLENLNIDTQFIFLRSLVSSVENKDNYKLFMWRSLRDFTTKGLKEKGSCSVVHSVNLWSLNVSSVDDILKANPINFTGKVVTQWTERLN